MPEFSLPKPVKEILETLHAAGFEAYAVGGCVRDTLLGREPKDWDVTTDARPEEIQKIFPESFYENSFGTVGVKVSPFLLHGKPNREEDIIEVTTYRIESSYTDKRHPDHVSFTDSLETDLSRRDFTINAIALGTDAKNQNLLIDPFEGQRDIRKKIIRTVGDPDARFGEDALRMMRAVRFFAELRTPTPQPKSNAADSPAPGIGDTSDWNIEESTLASLRKHASDIRTISPERVSAELEKILLSESPAEGIDMLQKSGLLRFILPELEEGVGVQQNLHHIYTVYEHNLRALATCPSGKLGVRLAALLHDVGKPRTKRGDGYHSTFYNHDHVGARMTRKILERLRFPSKIVDQATLLVDNHLFYYNVGEVTAASVRRLIRRVGLENMRDLMDIRIADRLGSGTPKAKPYKLRHLEYMIEKVSEDPVSVKMLAINGSDLIKELDFRPSPKIGAILDCLLAEVIDNPSRNTKEILLARAKELASEELDTLRNRAKETIEERRAEDDRAVKKKHWVS